MRWKQTLSDKIGHVHGSKKSLRKRTPKQGPKFVAKTGALTKGLLSAGAKVLTHDCCSFAGHQILCANNETDWLTRHKAGMRKAFKNASSKIVKIVAGGGPHFGVQKWTQKWGPSSASIYK